MSWNKFGAQPSFGATPNFSLNPPAASAANPFSTTSSFGANPFGAAAASASAPTAFGTFGVQAATQQQPAAAFGAFGQAVSAATPAFGTATNTFGQQSNAFSAGFGASATAAKPTFGVTSFGAQPGAAPSLFGQAPQQQQQPSLFGATNTFGATTATSGFGNSGFGATPGGSFGGAASAAPQTTRHTPFAQTDSGEKDANNRALYLQTITGQQQYQSYSLEELRCQDLGIATPAPGGAAPAAAAAPFGAQPASNSPFAAKPAGAFGGFAQQQQPAPAFGAQPAATGSFFGQSAPAATSSLFGQPQQQPAATTFGVFGQPQQQPAATTFGVFGQQQQQQQAAAPAFGFGQNASSPFGAAPAAANSSPFGGFGAKPAGAFGSTTGTAFGAQQPAGSATPGFGFGAQASASSAQPGAAFGAFGSSPAKPVSFGFGASAAAPGTPAPTVGFGGGFGSPAAQQQQQQPVMIAAAQPVQVVQYVQPSASAVKIDDAPKLKKTVVIPSATKSATTPYKSGMTALISSVATTAPATSASSLVPMAVPAPTTSVDPLELMRQAPRSAVRSHVRRFATAVTPVQPEHDLKSALSWSNAAAPQQQLSLSNAADAVDLYNADVSQTTRRVGGLRSLRLMPSDDLLKKISNPVPSSSTTSMAQPAVAEVPTEGLSIPASSPSLSSAPSVFDQQQLRESEFSNRNNIPPPTASTPSAKPTSSVKPVSHGPIYAAPADPNECLQFSPKLESITNPVSVYNFTVTHPIHGSIMWIGDTDVSNVNINECISFESRTVEVYGENFPNKPAQGFKLNKPAIISLNNVFPKNNRPVDVFKQKLMNDQNTRFISYDNGVWQFQVDHFSKYGLDDNGEDNDD